MEVSAGARALLAGLAALLAAGGAREVKVLDRYPGDLCTLQDGGAGVCRGLEHCAEVPEMLRQGFAPVVCSYKGTVPVVCCPSERKAHRKCQEYSSAVYGYVPDPGSPTGMRKCDQCVMKDVPFIVGGSNASAHEFPHMALLGYGNDRYNPRWNCGGSLISIRHVLTAAHCIITTSGTPKWVRLGELDLTTTRESKHEDYGVAEAIPHPDYKDGVHYDDIGVLRLDRDVLFTAAIRPACLHAQPEVDDSLGIACGWGLLHWADEENSKFLMKLNLHLYKKDVCSFAYRTTATTFRLRNGITEESMVCAGSPEGGKDTCRGDSGGPLMIKLKYPYCMYSLIGLTSFGKGACGTTTSPSVYTRVSYFVPWIEEVVWPDEPAPQQQPLAPDTRGLYFDVRQPMTEYGYVY